MKRDISKLVRKQLPKFVAKDYPQFLKLMEYYYDFKEAQKGNIKFEDIRNANVTRPEFKELLLKEFGYGLPFDIINSEKFDDNFIVMLKGLYSKKGTDEATSELFDKILPLIIDETQSNFKTDIQIDRPYDRVLKVSDGEWITNSSVFVKFARGFEDFNYSDLNIDHAIHTDGVTGESTKFVPYQIDQVAFYNKEDRSKEYRKGYMQIYTRDNINFQINDIVILQFTNGTRVMSSITSNTSKIQIINGGENFKDGELLIVDISDELGNVYKGLTIRVKTVDSNGAILEYDILNFSIDVPYDEIQIEVGGNTSKLEEISKFIKPKIVGNDIWISIKHKVNLLSDYGKVTHKNKDVFFGDYNDPNFNSNDSYDALLGKQGFLNKRISLNAVFKVKREAIAKYTGFYKNSIGLISGISKLQDGGQNNQFAYVINSENDPSSYKDILDNITHPIGNIRFSNKIIYNEFTDNVTSDSAVVLGNRVMYLSDFADVVDNSRLPHLLLAKYITKPLYDEFNQTVTFDRRLKALRERYELLKWIDQSFKKQYTKRIYELPKFITTYFGKRYAFPLNVSFNVNESIYKLFDMNTITEAILKFNDDFDKSYTKRFVEEPKIFRSGFDKNYNRILNDEILFVPTIMKTVQLDTFSSTFNVKDIFDHQFAKILVEQLAVYNKITKIDVVKILIDEIEVTHEILKIIKKETIKNSFNLLDDIIKQYTKNKDSSFKTIAYVSNKEFKRQLSDKSKLIDGGVYGLSVNLTTYKNMLNNSSDKFNSDLSDKFTHKFGELDVNYEGFNTTFGFTDKTNINNRPYMPLNVGIWSDFLNYINKKGK